MIAAAKPPLRRVVRLVQREVRYTATRRDGSTYQTSTWQARELLECGHINEAPRGLHGTNIGTAKRRRCERCANGEVADNPSGWVDL